MQTAAPLAAPPHRPVSRLLAALAHAPDWDPRLARGARLGPGDRLGRFEVLRELGRGGFGVVYEARDPVRRRRVAVKVPRPGAGGRAREILRRELQATRLRHRNIVAVLEGGRCERGPFLVLERLSGETLAERLARGPLPVRDVLRIATAVARALAHAHARGVLHRDLKPANVFLPTGAEAKLIDFGLARVRGSGGPRGSGTSRYMSPEQRAGAPEDGRTDLYALGLLVHEMATGSPPLRLPDGASAPSARPLSAPGMPHALGRLVDALVQRDPARRPGSAREVLRRLGKIRGDAEGRSTARRGRGERAPAREGTS